MARFLKLIIALTIIGSTFAYPQNANDEYDDDPLADETQESQETSAELPRRYYQSGANSQELSRRYNNINIAPPPAQYNNNNNRQNSYRTINNNFDDNNLVNTAQSIQRPAVFANDENYPDNGLTQRKNAPKRKFKDSLEDEDKELDEEKEEPDRLSSLLPNSKFSCDSKITGYYADISLDCEVFHYCQENAKHSWVCPDGFKFHQVHLICMPPSHDNICKKSEDFHFVNDYLYKPINEEEVQRKPNTTLRYHDRYFPENYYYEGHNAANSQEEDEEEERPQIRNQISLKRPIEYQNAFPIAGREIPQPFRPSSQVFHSPEDVNIPLQQRRPFYYNQNQ